MNVLCMFKLGCVPIRDKIQVTMVVLVLSSVGNLVAVVENIFDQYRAVFMTPAKHP